MAGAVIGAVTPVPRHSDEYARVEHLLQMSCRSTAVKEINAWTIANPHLNVQYERRSSGLLAVDCWVDMTMLDAANPIQDVCKRGFVVPDGGDGLLFTTGNMAFDLDGPGEWRQPAAHGQQAVDAPAPRRGKHGALPRAHHALPSPTCAAPQRPTSTCCAPLRWAGRTCSMTRRPSGSCPLATTACTYTQQVVAAPASRPGQGRAQLAATAARPRQPVT